MPAEKYETRFSEVCGSRRTSKWKSKVFLKKEKRKIGMIALWKSCVSIRQRAKLFGREGELYL